MCDTLVQFHFFCRRIRKSLAPIRLIRVRVRVEIVFVCDCLHVVCMFECAIIGRRIKVELINGEKCVQSHGALSVQVAETGWGGFVFRVATRRDG